MVRKIDSFSFGTIVVDGKKHHRDVILRPDGMVEERKGGVWRFGSHSFKKEEIAELEGAEIAIIGIGTLSRARLSEAARDYAEGSSLELLLLPSREAVARFNESVDQGKKPAAIVHITC
jgi:hypothetical protein